MSERLWINGDAGEHQVLSQLKADLSGSVCLDAVVAFTLQSGLRELEAPLRSFLEAEGRLRLLTGTTLEITEPEALAALLDLCDHFPKQVEVKVFEDAHRSFHPKSYLLTGAHGGIAYVGSSNLSRGALTTSVEWNLRLTQARDPQAFSEVKAAFETLWSDPAAARSIAPGSTRTEIDGWSAPCPRRARSTSRSARRTCRRPSPPRSRSRRWRR